MPDSGGDSSNLANLQRQSQRMPKNAEAVLSFLSEGEESWIVTGWKEKTPDATGEVSTHSVATQARPTFSRSDLGAGVINKIVQIGIIIKSDPFQTPNFGGIFGGMPKISLIYIAVITIY